jgi:chloramphenicol-sensitive protein RarD
MRTDRVRGIWYAAFAYGLWGLVPIYWKLLRDIPALQLICHRIVWSCVLLLILITVRLKPGPLTRQPRWGGKPDTTYDWVRSRRAAVIYSAAALVIAVNWFVYVWAVNRGFILQASLGYFINPLVNVVLGVIVFREKLRPAQWGAVALAAAGVLYLTVTYGSIPWIALTLAVSFGLYGLVKKMAPLGSVEGLALETSILFLPAAAYLIFVERDGSGGFLRAGVATQLLIAAAGPVTTIPLLFFASAARRVPLSIMGMLQYISPTVQFLLGVLLYHEPFTSMQFIGFALVWTALALFAVDGYVTRRWPPLGVAERV